MSNQTDYLITVTLKIANNVIIRKAFAKVDVVTQVKKRSYETLKRGPHYSSFFYVLHKFLLFFPLLVGYIFYFNYILL